MIWHEEVLDELIGALSAFKRSVFLGPDGRIAIATTWAPALARRLLSSLDRWGGLLGNEIMDPMAEWRRLASELIAGSGKFRVVHTSIVH